MPRTIIDLTTPQFQFNDQPLLHENIWKIANTIAQAPMQRQKLQMEADDRAQEQQMRTMQMDRMKADAEYAPIQRKNAEEDRRLRITNDAAKLKIDQDESDYRKEHLRQQAELEREKLAAQVDRDTGVTGNAKTSGRANPRQVQLFKMGQDANILPRANETDEMYANRVADTLAMQSNTTPSVPEKMILPSMLKANDDVLNPDDRRPVADITADAVNIAQASTPMARAGKGLAEAQKMDPTGFKLPTLDQALNPQAAQAAPAAAPRTAPAPQDNSLLGRTKREFEFATGRTPEEIKARMDVWKEKDPELWKAMLDAAMIAVGKKPYPNMQAALQGESPAPAPIPATDVASPFMWQ